MLKRISLFFLIFLVDQGLKLAALEGFLPLGLNRGVAFGFLAEPVWMGPVLTVIIAGVLLYILLAKKTSWAWWLILAGGASNLFDRLFRDAVVDVIFLPVLPAFNVADVAIVVGSVWLVARSLRR